MKRRLAMAAALMSSLPANAVADDDPHVGAGTTDGGLAANAVAASDGATPSASEPVRRSDGRVGPTIQLGTSGCAGATQIAATEKAVAFCPAPEPDARPVLTPAMIRSAFAELPLPASTLVIQPPDGLTLVNFATNFYTPSTSAITRTVTLLGQRVTLEATPSRYRWDFGDGTTTTTDEPGAPYPRLDVTHSYLRTGTYRPRLATTYTGRFRVAGGGWRAIPGTVTIQGAPQRLRAIEATPTLVDYE